jgi:hypothetical protein
MDAARLRRVNADLVLFIIINVKCFSIIIKLTSDYQSASLIKLSL